MGLAVGFTCHMPATHLQFTFKTRLPCFYTFVCVAVNVSVHPSSQICTMEISVTYCTWGNVCTASTLVASNVIWFILSLRVYYMRLPSGGSTQGPLAICALLVQGV